MTRKTPPRQDPDRLYARDEDPGRFRFDEAVARVFPDMIRRSVPGYTTIIPLIGVISARFAQPGSNCYDLGCSLGAATLAMRHAIGQRDCRIIAVDNSAAMIERCHHYIALDDGATPVSLYQEDILDTPVENASVVVLNFTLQFIAPEQRLGLLRRLHAGMRPGGALILSEKLRLEDGDDNELLDSLHLDFKRAQGYSELEISRKRSALEQVLVPESLDSHMKRLEEAGFDRVLPWYQCFNFASLLAIKS